MACGIPQSRTERFIVTLLDIIGFDVIRKKLSRA